MEQLIHQNIQHYKPVRVEEAKKIADAQQKLYKAYFIGVTDEDKKLFKESKCMVPISVGQAYHEGAKFEATISLLNKYFKECTILVCDTLQRHSLAIQNPELPEDQLYTIAKDEGNKWLARNINYINRLVIPYQISHWDDWIKHTSFNEGLSFVEDLYECSPEYKTAVFQSFEEFLRRKLRYTGIQDKALAVRQSIKYAQEECAVMYSWILKENYRYHLYKSDVHEAMKVMCAKICSDKIDYKGIFIDLKGKLPQHLNNL